MIETPIDASPASGRWFWMFLVLSAPVFYLFTFNSGYGYDQLEYLLIGRSFLEGREYLSFVPSKAIGIYLFTAGLIRFGILLTHESLSLVITLLYAVIVVATYWVGSRRFGRSVGALAAVLTGAGAFFMSLNFLETEGFVYLCGLLAFAIWPQAGGGGRLARLFLAGLAVGLGFSFKSVAGFYVVGMGLMLLDPVSRRAAGVGLGRAFWVEGPIFVLGFLLSAGIPFAWFAAKGRLADIWEWTVIFPLFYYPVSHLYAMKLVTKLLWFVMLVIGGIGLSFAPSNRRWVYASPDCRFALVVGLVALAPIYKTQAPHYFVPGAGFLSMFVAAVGIGWARRRGMAFRLTARTMGISAVAVVCMVGSVLLYKPDAFKRLVSLTDWEATERPAREFIQAHVSEDQVAWFTSSGPYFYWISHRYPGVPIINSNVQTSHYLRRHNPRLFQNVLDDPRLALAEYDGFDNDHWEDGAAISDPVVRGLVERFGAELARRFDKVKVEGIKTHDVTAYLPRR